MREVFPPFLVRIPPSTQKNSTTFPYHFINDNAYERAGKGVNPFADGEKLYQNYAF